MAETASDREPTPADLHRRAEELYAARPATPDPAPADTAARLRELGVRQIELELENEHLRRVQAEFEASRAQDLVAGRRAADAMRESEHRYRSLFEGNRAVMLLIDPGDGAIVDANPAACDWYGWSRSELLAMRIDEINTLSPAEVLIARAAGQTSVRNMEIETRRKDGTAIQGLFSADPIVLGDEPCLLTTMLDLTERKQAEEALAESEALLACAVDGSGVGLWDWYPQTGEETFNERWAEIAGYTLAELAPTSIDTWRELMHPDDLQRADELLEEHFAGESAIYSVEERVRHKDGHWVWVLDRGKVSEWDDEGRPVRMTGTALDITERKESEDALKQASDRLALATGAGGVGIWEYDVVGDRLLWDDQMFRLYGISREQFSGAYEAWQTGVHPDDRERGSAEIQMAVRGEKEFDTEFRVLRPDGTVRYIRALARAERDGSGRAVRMIGTNWDITESRLAEDALEQSEALYRSIMSASPENITITDLEGRIRLTSSAALGMFGYESLGEAQGRLLADFLVPEDRERAGADVALMHQGAAPAASEYRGLRADGSTFDIEVSGEFIRDAQERPTGMVFISRDISARRRAEDELRETTALLSGLLTSIPDIVFFKDRAGVYLGCNPEFARLVGRDADDVVGVTDHELFGDEAAAFFHEQDDIMMAAGRPRHNEEWIEYPDGARALIDTLKAPLRDADGNIIGLLGVSRDITARKEAEERLRESEEQLARAVEGSGAGLWDWDIPAREVTLNERWAEIAGYTLAELSPISVDDWNDMWHPDDLRRSDELIERHFAGESQMYECEVRVRHKDGHWVWVLDRGKVSEWDEEGRPLRMAGTQLDVTKRREAEETLRLRESYLSAIIENQPGLVWLKDTGGRFLAANTAFAAIAGRPGVDDVVGRTDLDLWAGDRAERYLADDVATMESVEPTVYQQAIDVDGVTRWFETFKAAVVDEEGTVLGTTGYAADVTERRLADERLRSANRQLEQAVAHANDLAVEAQSATTAKTRFLAHMSHEIRTPLNAIIGFAQLLQHDPELTAQQADRVTIINRSGEHLLALLSDILELSKVEAKVQRLERVPFDLRDLLDDLALVFGVRAEAKGLAFRMDALDETPHFVTGDQVKLRQTLTNLLANAVRFTDEGGVVLHASASPETEAGGYRLVVLVEDTGVGIADDEMGALFAPFEQTTSGLESRSGTGLGLAISRQFVKVMGGELSVTSKVGEGSVFRLEVPLGAGTADMTARSDARRVVRLEADQPAFVALVVDDDEDSRTLLCEMLGDVGFDVVAAGGGLEAVEAFGRRRPSIVLMDLWMPDVDGNEATRRIRAGEGGEAAKIIALTANFTDGVRSGALAAGADAFMAKPFQASALFEQIRLLTGVRYLYAEEADAAAAVDAPPVLDRTKMDALPEDLKQQIRDAAIRARHSRLLELAAQVAVVDPETGAALEKVIVTFDYSSVLLALEEEAT